MCVGVSSVSDAPAAARRLIAAGVGHGEHVALWLNNCADWIFIAFAIEKIGAVPTGAGLAASSTLMWIVPGGLVWGLGAAALTAGALTRGIGLVFVDSFETAMAERSGA